MNNADKEAKEKAKKSLLINKIKANAVPSSQSANQASQPTQITRG